MFPNASLRKCKKARANPSGGSTYQGLILRDVLDGEGGERMVVVAFPSPPLQGRGKINAARGVYVLCYEEKVPA